MAAVTDLQRLGYEDSWKPSDDGHLVELSQDDSDYGTDVEEEDFEPYKTELNIHWTGFGKRTPVILFKAAALQSTGQLFRTVGEHFHLSFKFAASDSQIIRNILVSHGFTEVNKNSLKYNLLWSSTHVKPNSIKFMTEFQKVNHFPRSCELTRKDMLYKNVQKMQQTKGYRHFEFIPPSFILPGEFHEFYSHFIKCKGLYIVKPVASSQGRGVYLINDPNQVPTQDRVIVSKYISSPLLIRGLKFDVRFYVAVTSYDPLVIYLYEEGLTRFATVKYEKEAKFMYSKCMHLTNYSVNKGSLNYIKNNNPDVEDHGNKWSLGAMLRHLRSEGRNTTALMLQVESVVIKTILCAESPIAEACKLYQSHRGNCFEIYGFDILIDDNLKPWMLEVNFSPSLACDSPLDNKIKSNMLCDLFSLVGVICQNPSLKSQHGGSRHVETGSRMGSRLMQFPQLAMSSPSSDDQGKITVTGLNSDEIKILRRVQEEEARKGGWVRIFPSSDSWDTYGYLVQNQSSHNLMLHKRLYPERHRLILLSTKPASSVAAISSLSRNGQTLISEPEKTAATSEDSDSYLDAVLRVRQYERKLKGQQNTSVRHRNRHSVPDKIFWQRNERSKERNINERQQLILTNKRKAQVTSHQSMTDQTLEPAVKAGGVDDVTVKNMPLVLTPEPGDSITQCNVSELIHHVHNLSEIQARAAFVAYLTRMQEKVLANWSSHTGPKGDKTVDQQFKLILQFLQCAMSDSPEPSLHPSSSVKLSSADKRNILIKHLGLFIYNYKKETESKRTAEQFTQSKGTKLKQSECLSDTNFNHFVSNATEDELERVLMAYVKRNKSAAIFLVKPSRPRCVEANSSQRRVYQTLNQEAEIKQTLGVEQMLKVTGAQRLKQYDSSLPLRPSQKLDRPHSASTTGISTTERSVFSRLSEPIYDVILKEPVVRVKKHVVKIKKPAVIAKEPVVRIKGSQPYLVTHNAGQLREMEINSTTSAATRQYHWKSLSPPDKPKPNLIQRQKTPAGQQQEQSSLAGRTGGPVRPDPNIRLIGQGMTRSLVSRPHRGRISLVGSCKRQC